MRFLGHLVFVPTLLWNIVITRWLGWWRWWDVVDDHVWLGSVPIADDVQRLRSAGVGGVINLCAECQGPVKSYEELGIRYLRIPLADYTSPLLSQVEECLSFIGEQISRGEIAYVHCKAGRGRSALVVLCWLMASRGLSPHEAEAFLVARRPQILKRLSQRRVVLEFERKLQRTNA